MTFGAMGFKMRIKPFNSEALACQTWHLKMLVGCTLFYFKNKKEYKG
jgi:hypothetical protein